jgi:hypothetical protein
MVLKNFDMNELKMVLKNFDMNELKNGFKKR